MMVSPCATLRAIACTAFAPAVLNACLSCAASAQAFADAGRAHVDYRIAASAPATSCTSLVGALNAEVSVTSAMLVAPANGVPEFCRVLATGLPQVQMEFALPTSWNRRLYMQGNGGYAGEKLDAPERVAQRELALRNGFAAMQTDTGHDGAGSPVGAWAADHPERIIDFAYRAVHLTNTAARALAARYYGAPPLRAYFNACSTGGRQALMSAQRYPADFDGYVGNAPVLDWTDTFTGFAWNQHVLRDTPLSIGQLATVHNAVVAKCDALDGLVDGRIRDPRLCSLVFDAARDVPACTAAADGDSCLTPSQAEALRKIWSGPISRGRRAAPGMSIDVEPAQLAPWLLGTSAAPAIERSYGLAHFTYLAPFPATATTAFSFDALDFDVDPYREDALRNVIDATSTDLSAFRARGGKFISIHGTSDPALTPLMSIDYAEQVNTRMGGAADFYRLYLNPGMAHCDSGTRAADVFDAMTPLIDWVEAGIAPDVIPSAKEDGAGAVLFTRKLCPYPRQETYLGGDPNDASSFTCANPLPVIAELQYGATSHYALSASLSEAYNVTSGAVGAQWRSTGNVFTGWPLDTPGTLPVHRFYFPATANGGAHFYTSNVQEMDGLRVSGSPWVDEGPQFAAKAPGSCTSTDVVLVRYYKGDVTTGLPQHRYLANDDGAAALRSQGWLREGEAMCVAAKISPL